MCPKLIAFNVSHLDGYREERTLRAAILEDDIMYINMRQCCVFDRIFGRGFSKGWSAMMLLIDSDFRLETVERQYIWAFIGCDDFFFHFAKRTNYRQPRVAVNGQNYSEYGKNLFSKISISTSA